MSVLLFSVLCGLAVVAYLLPTIIASLRGHRNEMAILIVNFFLGWTFVGWVVCLAWSCTDQSKR